MKHAVLISVSLVCMALGCASQPAVAPDVPVAPVVVDVDAQPTKGDAKTQQQEQAERDRKIAENAGILSALKDSGDASPFGASGALGDEAEDALGGLIGEPIGGAYGAGGLGRSGTGRGGGGAGTGGGGIGIGTIGRGQGGGASGYGSGSGRLGRSGRQPPKVRSGSASVSGQLGKDVIRRIVRRHFRNIRFCYEKRLDVNPTLAAKVTVRFVIGKTGKVVAASVTKASSDKQLDSCLLKAFRRMRFPKPDKGGVVSVSYPLIFKPAASPKSKPAK